MKKKLFAGAIVLLFYVVFVIGMSIADKGGHIKTAVSKAGLVNAASDLVAQNLEDGNLIDPMPKPSGPKPPPPQQS